MKLRKLVKGFQPAPPVRAQVHVSLEETWNGKRSTEFTIETNDAATIREAKRLGFKEV